MKTGAVVFGLIISLAAIGVAQVRTITNATLERHQQKRLAAERDYRDNYERMGFPSPEELERQREADMAARLELADQLRQARLEKERLELERRSLDLEEARMESESEVSEFGGYYGGYFGGFGGFGGFDSRGGRGKFRRHSRFGIFPRNRLLPIIDRRGAYRVTPFGVIAVPNPRSPRIVFRSGGIRGRRR